MQPQPTAPPGVRPRPGGPASRQHLPGRSRGRRCRSGPAPRPRRRPLEGSTGWSQAQPPVKRHTAHWGRLRAWGRARVAPSHAPHTAPRGSWRKQLQRRRRSPGGDPVLTLLTEELLNTAPGRGPQAAEDHAEDPPDLWAGALLPRLGQWCPPCGPERGAPPVRCLPHHRLQQGPCSQLQPGRPRSAPGPPCEPSAWCHCTAAPGACGPLVPSRWARSVSGPCPLPGQGHPQGTAGASSSVPLTKSPHTEAEPPGRR